MTNDDRYRTETIGVDKELAKTMGSLMESTKDNADDKIMSVHRNSAGDWGIKVKEGYLLASAPIFGNHHITEPYAIGTSFVLEASDLAETLTNEWEVKTRCVTVSNICDWGRRGNEEPLKQAIRQGLEDACKEYGIFNAAGESAVLRGRIPDAAVLNISGAATFTIPKYGMKPGVYTIPFNDKPLQVVVYDPKGDIIEQRCDGNGNKPRLNMEMTRNGLACSSDTLAMTRDDIGKKRVREVANILSVDLAKNTHDPFNGAFNLESMAKEYSFGVMRNLSNTGIPYAIAFSDVTGRMEGYGSMFINPNSTAIARVKEQGFFNPPMPKEGDHVFIFRANMNGRSNGWTQMIEDLVTYFHGNPDFHLHSDAGRKMLEMAGKGSFVYKPIFQRAFDLGATKVGHLSGGAYQEKFSDIFMKNGLGGEFMNPLPPYEIHNISQQIQGYDVQKLADKYNLCGDAWLSVPKSAVREMTDFLDAYEFQFADMGPLERMAKPEVGIHFSHPAVNGYARFTQG